MKYQIANGILAQTHKGEENGGEAAVVTDRKARICSQNLFRDAFQSEQIFPATPVKA